MLFSVLPVTILLMIFVVIPTFIFLIGRTQFSVIKNYEAYWGIKLPGHMELVSDYKSPASFHGDGSRYTVFYVPEKQQISLGFAVGRNSDIEEFCTEIINGLGAEEANFGLSYMWHRYEKYENTLVIIYFSETRQLHLFQKTI